MLHLISDITSSSSTSDALVTLCFALAHNNLDFASVVWNSVSLILLKSEDFNVNLLIYVTIHFSFTLAPRNMMPFWLGYIYLCFT